MTAVISRAGHASITFANVSPLLVSQSALELSRGCQVIPITTKLMALLQQEVGDENAGAYLSPFDYEILEDALRELDPKIPLKSIYDIQNGIRGFLVLPKTDDEARKLQGFLVALGNALLKHRQSYQR